MGAVYTAEQLSTGRLRAVKVMNPLLVDDAKQRQRFTQEARIGARVVSDHVVDVIAAGVDDELGMPWIAMELLEGDDLGEHVTRRGPQQVGQVLEVFRQLCHALGAAHQAGVVHRDVKPQNVFISTTQTATAPTAVKVLDFGIAKVAAAASAAGTAMVGSPAWMAPEQTDPQATITPGADVWALGLLAFWMLTGMSYWQAANTSQASMHALMKEVLFDDLPPASERAAVYDRAERLPEGFDPWFARCVDRDPAARFGDAAELYAALATITGDDSRADSAGDASHELTVADVGAMSTREFIESADLAAPPGDAAALSTRSFVESAELDVTVSGPGGDDPDDPPQADTTRDDTTKGPSTGELAYAGTLDASTASLAGQAEAHAASGAGDPWPKAARYAVGALALIAVAAVALVVGMRLDGRPQGGDAAGPSAVPPAAPATIASVTAGPTATPPPRATRSGAVATVPGMTPIENADRFDVSAGLLEAQRLARAKGADAKLAWFNARGVGDDGITNLMSGGSAGYVFRSIQARRCYTFTYLRVGRYFNTTDFDQCPTKIVDLPRCSVPEAIRRAKGGAELLNNPSCTVSFAWVRTRNRAGWAVACGGLANDAVMDDCK